MRSASRRSNSSTRLVAAPDERQRVDEPERARQEGALARWQAVVGLLGRIAQHEAVAHSSRSTASTVPITRSSSGGRKPTAGISSSDASSCLRAVGLRERAPLGVEAALADLVVDARRAVAASDRPVACMPNVLDGLHRAVEGHPGHHLRVHEVPARAADLPDALVGLASTPPRRSPSSARCMCQAYWSRLEPGLARLQERVHQLAVDVELELLRGGVADPHRRRALVAGQPVELELGQPPLAGRPVHDLQVRRPARHRRAAASRAMRAPRRGSRRSISASSVSVASRSQQ